MKVDVEGRGVRVCSNSCVGTRGPNRKSVGFNEPSDPSEHGAPLECRKERELTEENVGDDSNNLRRKLFQNSRLGLQVTKDCQS